MAKQKQIVTRDTIARMLDNPNRKYVEAVIGRALLALLDRQTADEKACADTREWNAVGFSGADARSGTLTAKFYAKHGCLLEWQVKKWTKPAKNGYPRLAKYAKQLNEIALEKGK
jgi:hypothetical protein